MVLVETTLPPASGAIPEHYKSLVLRFHYFLMSYQPHMSIKSFADFFGSQNLSSYSESIDAPRKENSL